MIRRQRSWASALALALSLALALAGPVPLVAAATAPPVVRHASPVARAVPLPKLRLRAGTPISLQLAEPLGSARSRTGDRFTLRVASDVSVGGQVLIRRGALALGTVTSARRSGNMGQGGSLHVTLDLVQAGASWVRVHAAGGLRGSDRTAASLALAGRVGPLGLMARGRNVAVPPGTAVTAWVDYDVELAALAPAGASR
jgi:hypothetical protein